MYLINNSTDIFIISNQLLNIYRKNKVSYRLKEKISFIFLLKRIIKIKIKKYKFDKKISCVFITHLINNNQLKTLNDSYLDKIITSTNDKGKFARFFINHINKSTVQKKISYKVTDYVIDFKLFLLNDLNILIYYLSKFINYKLFKKKIDFLNKRITLKSTLQAATNFKLAKTIVYLIKKNKRKKLIMPFEGHAWEKTLIFMIRKEKVDTKIILYQFNINNKDLLMFNYLGNKLLKPDLILLSGNYSKQLLSIRNNDINNLIIGSSKIYKVKINKKNKQNCLVIPEGDLNEINIFLNFVNKYLSNYSDMNFIFQIPPHMLNLKNRLENKYQNNKNILISGPNLNDNISNSRYVLYRGSSAVYNCIYNFCIPIFLKKNKFDELPFNINDHLMIEHFKISNINELRDIFKKNIKTKNNHKFIRNIFHPFNKKNLNQIDKFIRK